MSKVTIKDEEGQEWEFVEYGKPISLRPDEKYLEETGALTNQVPESMAIHFYNRPIFRRKPVRHTFGGVTFEETGEEREISPEGDWVLNVLGYPYFLIPGLSQGEYTILRPVALEQGAE